MASSAKYQVMFRMILQENCYSPLRKKKMASQEFLPNLSQNDNCLGLAQAWGWVFTCVVYTKYCNYYPPQCRWKVHYSPLLQWILLLTTWRHWISLTDWKLAVWKPVHIPYFLRNENRPTDMANKMEINPIIFFMYGSCTLSSIMVLSNWALYTGEKSDINNHLVQLLWWENVQLSVTGVSTTWFSKSMKTRSLWLLISLFSFVNLVELCYALRKRDDPAWTERDAGSCWQWFIGVCSTSWHR